MAPASGGPNRSSRSIAAPCRKISSSRFCSATRRARSPAPPNAMSANSSKPPAARLFLDEVGELPARGASETPARHPGRRSRAGRRAEAGESRRAAHLGHQSRSDRRHQSRPLPRGPVLSAACFPDHGAAVARARRRYPGAGPAFSGALCRGGRQTHPHRHARGAARACRPSLARQYPAVGKRRVPRRGAGRNRRHRAR